MICVANLIVLCSLHVRVGKISEFRSTLRQQKQLEINVKKTTSGLNPKFVLETHDYLNTLNQ